MTPVEKYAVSAEIEKSIADEAEARRGYYVFLVKFGHLLEERETEWLNEIIAEELKHSDMLRLIGERINGVQAEKFDFS